MTDARCDDEVGFSVQIQIGHSHAQAARPDGRSMELAAGVSCKRERLIQKKAVGGPVEYPKVRPAANARASDDVHLAVAIDIPGRDEDPTPKPCVIGKERTNKLARSATKYLDVGATSRPGSGNNIGESISIDVAGSHADAASESQRRRRKSPE